MHCCGCRAPAGSSISGKRSISRRSSRRSSMPFTTRITDKKAEIIVGELPPAWGDPTAVEQIFANLIGNAVHYLDAARPGRIEVGSSDRLRRNELAGFQCLLRQGQRSGHSRGIPSARLHRLQPAPRQCGSKGKALAWPWSVGWSSGMAARSGWSRRRASAPRFSSPCRPSPTGDHVSRSS